MKLSVFTVATPELEPEELAAAAKLAGIHGIEWRYKERAPQTVDGLSSFWGNNLSTISPSGGEAELTRFKQATELHGLTTISVTPYLRAGDLEGTEEVLKAARYMGASYIRLGVPGYDRSKPFGELFDLAIAYLKEAEALCKRYEVKGLIEIHHGTIAASASGARRLCEGLDPSFIGVLFDPGNSVFEGFENYRMALEILGPYLAHVHVKNAGWKADGKTEDGSANWVCDWEGLKEGMVPWRQVIADLLAVGYDGYLGVEDFSKQFADSPSMLNHFSEYIGGLVAELRQDV
ncbi:sugar phosphate isomerase/epimerase family protein [Cohnella silvisoli]|uniref:Sugar phosphate isomerase/epimerase family protein n=1 Tax=Cohnella silvisoli TaxID=2873699 RepID=A0ABV1KT35_9BACL|nr:sugar phosphate isomerase/epimerase family protein [Cohnella silvisoli]MCD9021441.1 sugar phosphate isomerase/epimerase [Cohnella silvisoli]